MIHMILSVKVPHDEQWARDFLQDMLFLPALLQTMILLETRGPQKPNDDIILDPLMPETA